MRNSFLAIGAIASILSINGAIAAGENTVTSKSYVDAQDALKQDKITSKTTGNVVTYNGTDKNGQTQFDERGIFDRTTGWDDQNGQLVEGHEGDLMTAGDVIPVINSIDNDIGNLHTNISNVDNKIISIASQPLTPVTVQLPLTCANEKEGCTLWQIGDTDVAHKLTSCTTATVATDCPACVSGTIKTCTNNVCACTVPAACVPGGSCTRDADCGSGGTCSGSGVSESSDLVVGGHCQCTIPKPKI